MIGRTQDIKRHAGSNKWGSLKQPMGLLNREPQTSKKTTTLASVQGVMHCYSRAPILAKSKYNHINSTWINIGCLVTNVTLNYKTNTNIYTLDPKDASNLDEKKRKKKKLRP